MASLFDLGSRSGNPAGLAGDLQRSIPRRKAAASGIDPRWTAPGVFPAGRSPMPTINSPSSFTPNALGQPSTSDPFANLNVQGFGQSASFQLPANTIKPTSFAANQPDYQANTQAAATGNNQSFGGYGNFQYGPPTIADRGMAEGQGIRNMMMGGQAGFAGNMQNAMGQMFMVNQLNAERATENRRTDAISRIFGQSQAPQFGMPNVALPSGGVTQGGVYSSPYQGVTPAGPEGLTGGATQQYSDAFGANTALANTRTDLAGSEADAQYSMAARMADSQVMQQLMAMQTQQQGNQMGYNQGLQRLMAAVA